MTNLYELKLSDLLPPSIKNDIVISSLAKALDNELQSISKLIIETEIMSRIDELQEELIDLLAWQFHVDFYEPLGLDIDKKRTLVKNSISWHRKKGTKWLLEEILKILFLEDYDVIEWFEYEGKPYFFKLATWDNIESEDKYNRLINVIESVKNVRSWLDYILLYKQNKNDIYYGIINREKHSSITIYESHINDTCNQYYTGHLTLEVQNNHIAHESIINDAKNIYSIAHIARSSTKLISMFDNSINAKSEITQMTFSICLIHIKIGCSVLKDLN